MTILTRRTALLLALALVATMAIAGVADAVTKVGTNGSNILFGTRGSDTLYGLNGVDQIVGKAGADDLYGSRGQDFNMIGGRGDDYLVGGSGRDALYGGPGDDIVEAADGQHDYIDCGNMDEDRADRASVDAGLDDVYDCEVVNGRRR